MSLSFSTSLPPPALPGTAYVTVSCNSELIQNRLLAQGMRHHSDLFEMSALFELYQQKSWGSIVCRVAAGAVTRFEFRGLGAWLGWASGGMEPGWPPCAVIKGEGAVTLGEWENTPVPAA